jgi:hypothetical protein
MEEEKKSRPSEVGVALHGPREEGRIQAEGVNHGSHLRDTD